MTDPTTPDDPDDSEDDRPEDDRPEDSDRADGLFGRLADIVEALDDLDPEAVEGGEGRIDRGDVSVDFDYDVRVGLGGDRDSEFRPRRRDQTNPRGRANVGAGRRGDDDRETRVVDAADLAADADAEADDGRSYHVDVEESGDRTRLLADLPGVDEDAVDVAVEDGAVVVRVDGDPVERVPLDDDDGDLVTDVTFNNGVLVVEARRPGEDTEAGDDAGADDGESDPTGDRGPTDDGAAGDDGGRR